MKHWNIKKIILAFIFLLVCCDVSFLFAAQIAGDNNSTTQQQLEQIQQLQQDASKTPNPANNLAQNEVQQETVQPQTLQTQPQSPTNQTLAQATPIDPATAAVNNDPMTALPPAAPPANQNLTASQSVNAQPPTNQPVTAESTLQTVPPTTPLPPPGSIPPQTLAGANNAAQLAQQQNVGMVSDQELSNQAFNAMVKSQLPMTPEQIQRLRELFNQSQFAAASTPGTPPKPVATSQMVNLEPGSTPPVIRLAQGFITSLVFIDSTGAPWPIEAYDIGNPQAFNIQWNKSDNTLMIQSTTLYTYGNLAVRLQGLPTPVMITLIPGGAAVDYRVDLRIPGTGPNAIAVPVVGLPVSANPELLGVLDGIGPTGSTEMHVCGSCVGGDSGTQAWVRGEQLFVRTHYTLLSPGWIATMSSADGMKAYQLRKSPLLLIAQNGKIVQLKIEGL